MVAHHQHSAEDMAAYDRLLREAMGPALGCSTPAHDYEPGAWGPSGVDRLIARDGGWHCPSARAVAW